MKPFKMNKSKDGQYYYTVGTKGVLATSETFVSEKNAVISCIRLHNIFSTVKYRPLLEHDRKHFKANYIMVKYKK
jgi:uncharacterized protein YegP (UPF0339 family)